MFDRLLDFAIEDPRRLRDIGRGIANTGWLILMFGLAGFVATSASSVIQGIANKPAAKATLASVYPSLPTWWIPETPSGCLPAVMLVIVGWVLASLAKRIQRVYF